MDLTAQLAYLLSFLLLLSLPRATAFYVPGKYPSNALYGLDSTRHIAVYFAVLNMQVLFSVVGAG